MLCFTNGFATWSTNCKLRNVPFQVICHNEVHFYHNSCIKYYMVALEREVSYVFQNLTSQILNKVKCWVKRVKCVKLIVSQNCTWCFLNNILLKKKHSNYLIEKYKYGNKEGLKNQSEPLIIILIVNELLKVI